MEAVAAQAVAQVAAVAPAEEEDNINHKVSHYIQNIEALLYFDSK